MSKNTIIIWNYRRCLTTSCYSTLRERILYDNDFAQRRTRTRLRNSVSESHAKTPTDTDKNAEM